MHYQTLMDLADERAAANGVNYLVACDEVKALLETRGAKVEVGPHINKQVFLEVDMDDDLWYIAFSARGAEVIQKSNMIL